MTQFDNVPEDQQKAWWMEQASGLLQQQDMLEASIEWLAYTHNAVFNVIYEGQSYILRLQQGDTVLALQSEVDVLTALQQAGLAAPQPEWTKQSGQVCGVLLRYVEGEPYIAEDVPAVAMRSIGQYLAQMHALPLAVKQRPSLDYDGLFGESGIYYPGEAAMSAFTNQQIAVMDAVAERVKAAMDDLGKEEDEFGLIHGDFLLKNILFHEGEVRALDFEYCGWGYYLYDLTPILWQLKPQGRYPALEAALWEGYTSVRPLTSRHRQLLETFIAGRQVASMRWVAANRHNPAYQGKVEAIMAQRTVELQEFLDSGILNRS